jgi:hypothetical protein
MRGPRHRAVDVETEKPIWRPRPERTNPATLLVPNPFQPDLNNLIPFQGNIGTRSMSVRDINLPYPYFLGNLLGAANGCSPEQRKQLLHLAERYPIARLQPRCTTCRSAEGRWISTTAC